MNPQTISTVTKSIKIYSDNHIHVALAKVIDACEASDGDGDPIDLATALHHATSDLNDLAYYRRIEKLRAIG